MALQQKHSAYFLTNMPQAAEIVITPLKPKLV
jgi:hypothetical protein